MIKLLLMCALVSGCAKATESTGAISSTGRPQCCTEGTDCVKYHLRDDAGNITHACWSPTADTESCSICQRVGG